MRVAYYGEMDPFSGGVDQRWESLRVLVRDLKTLLLLYDAVIVQPGNLIEHGLALPAFEQLAPFVRTGKLTTSMDPSSPDPRTFLNERIELYFGDGARAHVGHGTRHGVRPGTLRFQRRKEVEELRSRWRDLLPPTWSVTRDVGTQVAGFAKLVRRACAETQYPSAAARWILRVIDVVLDARGSAPSRSELLAHLASKWGEISPRDLGRMVLVIQTAYFNFGVSAHENPGSQGDPSICRLFLGRFASILRDNELRLAGLRSPAFDWNAHPADVAVRLHRLGVDVERVLALSDEDLFVFSQSPGWRRFRSLLEGPTLLAEVEQEISLALAGRLDLRDAIERVLPLVDAVAGNPVARPTPTVLPAPWQLAVQVVLGPARAGSREEDVVTLDLHALTLRHDDHVASMPRAESHIVTLLIIAGDLGLSVDHIKQLTFDIDQLQCGRTEGSLRSWSLQTREAKRRDAARRVRVSVLKNRANVILLDFGFRIDVITGKGRWRMVAISDSGSRLQINGTIWDLLETRAVHEQPPDLSAQQKALWEALVDAVPSYVSVRLLARALGKDHNALGLKQTVDAVGKLNGSLARKGARVRVVRVKRGLYSLMPRCPEAVGEVS